MRRRGATAIGRSRSGRAATGLRAVLVLLVWVTTFILHQPVVFAEEEPKCEAKEWQIKGLLAALEDRDKHVVIQALYRSVEWNCADRISVEKSEGLIRQLNDPDPYVRRATVAVLASAGQAPKEVIPTLIELLSQNYDYGLQKVASDALVRMGKEAKEAIPKLTELLENKNPSVQFVAVNTLGRMGEVAKEAIPKLIERRSNEEDAWMRPSVAEALVLIDKAKEVPRLLKGLDDKTAGVRAASAHALGNMGQAAPAEAIAHLIKRLDDKDPRVREEAARALGKIGNVAEVAVPELTKRLADRDSSVREAAAYALGGFGRGASKAIPNLLNQLNDRYASVRIAVVMALREMGEPASDVIPMLLEQLRQGNYWAVPALGERAVPTLIELLDDPRVRTDVIDALGSMGETAKEATPKLIKYLDDDDPNSPVPRMAARTLGHIGEAAKEAIPKLLQMLQTEMQMHRLMLDVDDDFLKALASIAPVGMEHLPAILAPIYRYTSRRTDLLLLAHIAGAGDPDIERAVLWLGRTAETLPETLPTDRTSLIDTLNAFEKLWPHSKSYPELRGDLASKIADFIRAGHAASQWSANDLPLLRRHHENLLQANMNQADSVRIVIDDLSPKVWPYLYRGAGGWGIHIGFWLLLIFVYPRSRMVQAIFFWNPWIRRFIGLGYVGPLLTWVPFLRRRLLAPFKPSLLADAALDSFDHRTFFSRLEVTDCSTARRRNARLRDVLDRPRGQVVLIGETGLGKTMALRDILRRSTRIAAYLPADRCHNGVPEAILKKLEGPAKDPAFVRNLVYAGALDIYIDGLNEVGPDTRAKVTSFAEDYTQGNIVMATQPLPDWKPPPSAKVYELKPLDSDQIEDFLLKNEIDEASVTGLRYERVCQRFLKQALREDQPAEMLDAARRVLSNPMDLTLVAQMLAAGIQPDLYRLQAQQYQTMAADYEKKNVKPFPLSAFSEHAYVMRRNDETAIAEDRFSLECMAMQPYRMVLKREWADQKKQTHAEWRFRHDKIMDFFIAQTFLGKDNPRRPDSEHMKDPRFRGVYFLLALLLAPEQANALKELLVEYAAATGDHTTSDGVVNLLRARRAVEGKQPVA